MPKKKNARAHSSDDDFVVTSEDSLSKNEYESPNEDSSEESDSPPPKHGSSPPARSTRRQSNRTPAPAIRQRKEAQLGALEKLKSARKALETRKKAAPTYKPPTKPDVSLDNASDDSWSEKEKEENSSVSPSPPPARKQARGKRKPLAATTATARRGSKQRSAQKPSALLLGHRDYTERDHGGGRGSGGGYYSEEEDIADFIASSSGEEEDSYTSNSEESEQESDLGGSSDEEKPKEIKISKKKASSRGAGKVKAKAKAKEKGALKRKGNVEKKRKKRQHTSSEEEEEEEVVTEEEEEEEKKDDDEEERLVASQERRRLKLRTKPEIVIISSSSESEEDIDAVLAATTKSKPEETSLKPSVAIGGTLEKTGTGDSAQKRKRLRKLVDTVMEEVPLRSLTQQPEKERIQLNKDEKDATKEPEPQLRQPRPPQLSAAERIAAAQAAFKARTREPTKEESSDTDNDDEYEDAEEENGALVSDSAGSLRDMIIDDDEEEEEIDNNINLAHSSGGGGGSAGGVDSASKSRKKKKHSTTGTGASPTWNEKVDVLNEWRSEQQWYRDDEACFYDYVEYLLMCYVDPTYRARINESKEHRTHFQHSVRRIETKMTTARDAVHSEAWRSCSRGLLEAVEWLPGAQSNWDPDSVREDTEFGYGDDEDIWGEDVPHYIKCAACNRKNSHATRTIIFKGRPRPPPEDETWEDVPANKKLSEKYLAASPVYKKKRSPVKLSRLGGAGAGGGGGRLVGGRRGFQLGFRDESENEYDSEDSLSLFIQRTRRASQQAEHGQDDDGPEADLPFDPEKGPSGQEYIRREFPVGRQCSARLMLYHGMFHWKHRLLSRLKFELKEERRRRKRANLPVDPGSVSDGVLSREPLKKALWNNFKDLTALGEAHQLAGGEIGNSAWRGGPAVDPHRQVVAVLAALHDDSDGEESDVHWGNPGANEDGSEEVEDDDGDDDDDFVNKGDKKRRKIAQMYKKKRQKPVQTGSAKEREVPGQHAGEAGAGGASTSGWRNLKAGGRDGKAQQVDIRNFFGSPVKEEEEAQETGRIDSDDELPSWMKKKSKK